MDVGGDYDIIKGWYWRYRITRDGQIGYVRRLDMTFAERRDMAAQLRAGGKKNMTSGDDHDHDAFAQWLYEKITSNK